MTDSRLIPFITARLDEWEAIAKAATGSSWHWADETEGDGSHGPDLVSDKMIDYLSTFDREPLGTQYATDVLTAWGHDDWGIDIGEPDQAHIAYNDPAHALAVVPFLRDLMDPHESVNFGRSDEYGTSGDVIACVECSHFDNRSYRSEVPIDGCEVLRGLAAIWKRHPDYPGVAEECDA